MCYWFGPVSNKRTQKIIQWTLQLTGLVSIFNSSYYKEAAMGLIVILLIVYNFPKSWISILKTHW